MPYASSIDEALITIQNLITVVGKGQPQSPLSLKDEEMENFHNLAKISKKKNLENPSQQRVGEKKDNSQQRVGDNHNDTHQRVPNIHRTPHSYAHKRESNHMYPTRLKNPPRPKRKTRMQVNTLETIKEEPNQQVQQSLRAALHKLKQDRIQKAAHQYNSPLTPTPLQELQNELALVLMCEETGKLLNYRKILKKNIKTHGQSHVPMNLEE